MAFPGIVMLLDGMKKCLSRHFKSASSICKPLQEAESKELPECQKTFKTEAIPSKFPTDGEPISKGIQHSMVT
jgi:hypothetical protein